MNLVLVGASGKMGTVIQNLINSTEINLVGKVGLFTNSTDST
jgi:dihydrodipicolinate reductase